MIVGRVAVLHEGKQVDVQLLHTGEEIGINDADGNVFLKIYIEHMPWDLVWDGDHSDHPSDRQEVWARDEAIKFIMGPPGSRIVDLGCGTGLQVQAFKDFGYEAVGITYQKLEYEIALHHGRQVILSDIHKTPFPDKSFDSFLMWDVLEHTVSPYAVLCEANRICKPGAKGLIFIPGQSWDEVSYHIIVPTQRQMKHLLELSGWKLVKMDDLTHARDNPEDDAEMAIYYVQKEEKE